MFAWSNPGKMKRFQGPHFDEYTVPKPGRGAAVFGPAINEVLVRM